MGITWSFSCNIQQGLWKFLESRLGNVNVMYQRYQPNQNQNDQWLHDKWTWGFPKQVIHKTIGPPTKKNTKTTSRYQRTGQSRAYVQCKSRETLLNSGTYFHHISISNEKRSTGDAHLVSLGSLASRFQSPPRSCQWLPKAKAHQQIIPSPIVDVDRIHMFHLKHFHFTQRCHIST